MAGPSTNPDTYNRTAINWDYSGLFGGTVINAQVDVTRIAIGQFQRTQPATLHPATAFNYNGVGQQLATAIVGAPTASPVMR